MENGKASWKEKVHPAFFEITEMYRELVLDLQHAGTNAGAELAEQIQGRAVDKLMEIQRRHPGLPDDVYSLIIFGPPDLPVKEVFRNLPATLPRRLMIWICWKRYRCPLYQVAFEDAAGIRESSRKMERIIAEGNKLRYGEKLPGFKIGLDHAGLLEMGWTLGLDKLTTEELADCFEDVCPCGKGHDADALKKQRARLSKALAAAKAWNENPPKPVGDYISHHSQERD